MAGSSGRCENGKGEGGRRVGGGTPRRRTFPGTFNHPSSPLLPPPPSRFRSRYPGRTPYIYLSAPLSRSVSLAFFLFLAIFSLRERFTETACCSGETLLNIENRTGCFPSAPPPLGYTWVAFVSETANASRMPIRRLPCLPGSSAHAIRFNCRSLSRPSHSRTPLSRSFIADSAYSVRYPAPFFSPFTL